jgi:RNA polymerase sigma-70 factor (ECF subfamily)
MMKNDDKNLVKECLKANRKAFETLVDRYQNVVFNVAYRMVGDFDQAEDIAQTVFIKAFENLPNFNPKHKFFSWLYRITINESLNFLKSKKRIENLNILEETKDKNPEQKYLEVELSDKIQAALMKLEPQHRLLILLKHFQYCSYKEISDSLAIPEKTVKSRLYTARQLLKEVLIKQGAVLS